MSSRTVSFFVCAWAPTRRSSRRAAPRCAAGSRSWRSRSPRPGAIDAIAHFAKSGEAIAGGGTVLTVDDVRAVARAGGRFVLSPVFDPEVVDEAHRLGLLAVPGTSTPTEILAAHRHGARLVKVFPAACLGGAAYIRAVRGPLPGIPLVPTNGITADTIVDYVEAGAVAVGWERKCSRRTSPSATSKMRRAAYATRWTRRAHTRTRSSGHSKRATNKRRPGHLAVTGPSCSRRLLSSSSRRSLFPAPPAQRVAEQKLDLSVQAAQVVLRPAVELVEHFRGQANQE